MWPFLGQVDPSEGFGGGREETEALKMEESRL